jgi:hypothetical protein
MQMTRLILIATVFILMSGSFPEKANAQTQISADMLRAICNYPNLPEQHRANAKQMCHGHLRGFFDYHNVISVMNKPARIFCLPKSGIPLGMTREIYMRDANQKSKDELTRTPAGFVLMMALAAQYPCR